MKLQIHWSGFDAYNNGAHIQQKNRICIED